MFKIYHGYAGPGGFISRFTIDWRCSHCDSEHVARDPLDRRELRWCDGGPSTEDEMRYWSCDNCGNRILGQNMKQVYTKLKLTADEERQERLLLEVRERRYAQRMADLARVRETDDHS